MKIVFRISFVAMILFCSINLFAQSNENETRKVRERAEGFLKAVSEKNTEETFNYLAIVIRKNEKTLIEKFIDLEEPDAEGKNEIFNMLSKFEEPDYKKICKISFSEKEKNIVNIEYEQEDLEGFKMILIDGQWYFAMEIIVD